MIPGTVVIDFNFRFASESARAEEPAAARARRPGPPRPGLRARTGWSAASPSSPRPANWSARCRRRSARETGIETELSTTGGTSDGRFISRICPQVIEFGPINASIHKIDEHVRVADIEPLKNIYRRTLENLDTALAMKLIDLVEASGRAAGSRRRGLRPRHHQCLRRSGLAGAVAAWACRWTSWTRMPTRARVARSSRTACASWCAERIASRKPAAYLTREAWLQGVPFYVDERAIVPRSFIAELLADGDHRSLAGRTHAARAGPVHRQRQPGRAGRDGLSRRRSGCGRHLAPTRWKWRASTSTSTACRSASGWCSPTAWPPLPGPYDLILCNPPYVNAQSMAQLPAEYRAEPALALAGGADGMDFIRALLRDAPSRMSDAGRAGAGDRQRARAFRGRVSAAGGGVAGDQRGRGPGAAADAKKPCHCGLDPQSIAAGVDALRYLVR